MIFVVVIAIGHWMTTWQRPVLSTFIHVKNPRTGNLLGQPFKDNGITNYKLVSAGSGPGDRPAPGDCPKPPTPKASFTMRGFNLRIISFRNMPLLFGEFAQVQSNLRLYILSEIDLALWMLCGERKSHWKSTILKWELPFRVLSFDTFASSFQSKIRKRQIWGGSEWFLFQESSQELCLARKRAQKRRLVTY